MSSVATVSRPELYPVGTSVKLYQLPAQAPPELAQRTGDPGTWTPALTLAATETVGANGSISWSGLTAGSGDYLAWANVGGRDVYLRVQLGSPASPAGREPWNVTSTASGAEATAEAAAIPGRRRVVTQISADVVSVGAVATATALDVTLQVTGDGTVFHRKLQSAKTAGAGEGHDSLSVPVNIRGNVGQAVKLRCSAPAANAEVVLQMSGYVE